MAPANKSARYPLIALWVHPRSMSTATERIVRERGDVACFHEPFLYYYYIGRAQRPLAHFDHDPERPVTVDAICDELLAAVSDGPVFFKDMAYYVLPKLAQFESFVQRTTHVALIRDPRKALVSFYNLDPDFTDEELGFVALRDLSQLVERVTGAPPLILQAEKIQAAPDVEMRRLWDAAGLVDRPDALSWSRDDPAPADWTAVQGWHQSVLGSDGIRPPAGPEADEALERRLEDVLSQAPHLEAVLARHQHAYDELVALSSRQ